MKKKHIYLLFSIYLFTNLVITNSGFAKKPGTTACNFLKIGVGARPIGMGGAFAGVADDINTIYWNPGGLGNIKTAQATVMHLDWFENITCEYIAYVQPLTIKKSKVKPFIKSTENELRHLIKTKSKFWNIEEKVDVVEEFETREDDTIYKKIYRVVGIAINSLTYGNIPRTEIDNDGNPIIKDNSFKASDLVISLSYGEKITHNMAMGFNFKVIQQKIEDEKANGIACDLGILYDVDFGIQKEKINIGLVIQNLGPKIKFISESDSLPINIKLGAGYFSIPSNQQIFSDIHKFNLALDINFPIDNDINFCIGSEYWYKNLIAARVGFNSQTISDLGGLSGLSIGIGFKWREYGIDYAWVPYVDLGNTHRLSLYISF